MSDDPWQFIEIRSVTPAKAGVQRTRIKRINTLLDAGLRRHDGIMTNGAIFNKLPKHESITRNPFHALPRI